MTQDSLTAILLLLLGLIGWTILVAFTAWVAYDTVDALRRRDERKDAEAAAKGGA